MGLVRSLIGSQPIMIFAATLPANHTFSVADFIEFLSTRCIIWKTLDKIDWIHVIYFSDGIVFLFIFYNSYKKYNCYQ